MKAMMLLLTISFFISVNAHDNVPGKKQSHPILLKGGTIHTVSHDILQNTDLLFENGKITQIGKNLQLPANTEIIDISGQHVYPGLISAYTNIGLVEIGSVRATNDQNEVGSFNPEVSSHTAYNPDSEIIPTVRSNGITTVLVAPLGSWIAGQSSIIHLDAWTKEDGAVLLDNALQLHWPNMTISTSPWMRLSPEKQRENIANNIQDIQQFFSDAVNYSKNPEKRDLRLTAMLPYIKGEKTVFIHANSLRQITAAVQFALEFKLKWILVGGNESYLCLDLLKENQVKVILSQTHRLPSSEDEDIDMPYKLPKLLSDAGIPFALSALNSSYWANFNLPFLAGHSAGFGLSAESALRAITLTVAEFFGMDKNYGSLDLGKSATIVVSAGDILDMKSHKVTYSFIDGRKVDLNNRHKKLYEKYKQKELK